MTKIVKPLKESEVHLRIIEHALRAHHKFQSEFGITYAKDDDGEYHEIDMSDGYGDSTLCEQTWQALKHFETIRAQIRAEALEEAAAYCEAHAMSNARRMGFEYEPEPYSGSDEQHGAMHEGMGYAASIRTLKEKGET